MFTCHYIFSTTLMFEWFNVPNNYIWIPYEIVEISVNDFALKQNGFLALLAGVRDFVWARSVFWVADSSVEESLVA